MPFENKRILKLNTFVATLLILIFFSCSPDGSPTPPPSVSSEKKINSFIFKKVDNPNLSADVVGIIELNTIKAEVPNGASLTALTPTINFSGKSIRPSSSVTQNFSTTVNYEVTAEDGTIKSYSVIINKFFPGATLYINTRYGNIGNGNVYAFDPATGKLKWKLPAFSNQLTSSIEFANGVLYTGIGNNLVAIDTATRVFKWQYITGASMYSTPTFANGILYTNSDDGYIHAVNSATGNLLWKYQQGVLSNLGNYSSPTVINGIVYVGSMDNYVYAIDATTGILKWKKTFPLLGSEIHSSPSVVNGIVYIGYSNYLLALNAVDGALIWAANMSGFVNPSPTVINDVVYVASSSGSVCAFNALNGQVLWNRSTSGGIDGSPIVSDGTVYVGQDVSNNPYLFAIDAASGSVKWMRKSDYSHASSPVVFNGTVYIGSYSSLIAIDANSGILKWRYDAVDNAEEFAAGPCIVDNQGNVYLSSISGSKN